MSKLKVANVTEDGRWLGPQARIAKVADRLNADHDIQTIVVCPEKDSERFQRRLSEAGVPCRSTSMHHLTLYVPELIGYIVFFLPEIARLVKILKDEAVDLVHCNGPWQIKGMIAAGVAGTPAIWHLNDTRENLAVKLLFNSLAPFLATGFIAASHRTKNHYLDRNWAKKKPIRVIQAPVDTNQFDPQRTEPSELIDGHDGVKLATVGSVNPQKGIDDLVECAEIVQERYNSKIHFFVVGPIYESQRKYGNNLKEIVRSKGLNVHFLGRRDDVGRILKSSDIYVCSSRSEASPTVVWEAMAMGLPIVSTDVGDVAQFLEGNLRCGCVVPTNRPEELAGSISSLVKDSRKREKFSKRAREVAISELDLNLCVHRHANTYRDLLSRSR